MTKSVIDAGDELPLTMPSLLAARVATRAEHVFVAVDGESLTYAEADRRSAALARSLLAIGTSAGTRVGILYPNGASFVVAWLALARIGAVSVPLSTFSTPAELSGLLRGSDVAALLTASVYRSHDYVSGLSTALPELDLTKPPPLMSTTTPSLRHVVFEQAPSNVTIDPAWTLAGLLSAGDVIGVDVLVAAETAVTPADRMVIVHTSGSTSEPKGVLHTHGAMIRHLDNLNQLRRYEEDEILFSNSPFFWIGGFAYALLGTLVAGATLVCSNAASASDVLTVLERERPTMVNGFAASVAHIAEDPTFAGRNLSSIRRGNLYPIMPAAVRPEDPQLHHAMLGMTEAGSVCLASEDESKQPEHRRGSFGGPVPGFEAWVRRLSDGQTSEPGEIGELHFRGPFLMEGYDGVERHDTFDLDGWFHTGDLVTFDDDRFFYFRGRDSDMIKTSGANVSPREVEAALFEVSGLVAHVVGVDDVERGQVVAALIRVPVETEIDPDALRTQLRDLLSTYKIPKWIVCVPEGDVPMMSSGKIDLRAIAAIFETEEARRGA